MEQTESTNRGGCIHRTISGDGMEIAGRVQGQGPPVVLVHGGAVTPDVLAQVNVPVLLLQGADTAPWFRESVRYVAEMLRDATVVTVSGAGHLGPRLAPEPVAKALIQFFTSAQ